MQVYTHAHTHTKDKYAWRAHPVTHLIGLAKTTHIYIYIIYMYMYIYGVYNSGVFGRVVIKYIYGSG